MEKRAKTMDITGMVRASENAKARVRSWLDQAERAGKDTERKNRRAAQECVACYYSDRMGGCAITHQPCMCCGEMQTYSNTATDALCKACAQSHDLCKHCGGDIKMRSRRKQGWPEPEAQ